MEREREIESISICLKYKNTKNDTKVVIDFDFYNKQMFI